MTTNNDKFNKLNNNLFKLSDKKRFDEINEDSDVFIQDTSQKKGWPIADYAHTMSSTWYVFDLANIHRATVQVLACEGLNEPLLLISEVNTVAAWHNKHDALLAAMPCGNDKAFNNFKNFITELVGGNEFLGKSWWLSQNMRCTDKHFK